MIKKLGDLFPIFYKTNRVLKLGSLAFPGGPGGFRELRGAGRKHFHLSWYLSDAAVTSYGQKPWRGFFIEYGTRAEKRPTKIPKNRRKLKKTKENLR